MESLYKVSYEDYHFDEGSKKPFFKLEELLSDYRPKIEATKVYTDNDNHFFLFNGEIITSLEDIDSKIIVNPNLFYATNMALAEEGLKVKWEQINNRYSNDLHFFNRIKKYIKSSRYQDAHSNYKESIIEKINQTYDEAKHLDHAFISINLIYNHTFYPKLFFEFTKSFQMSDANVKKFNEIKENDILLERKIDGSVEVLAKGSINKVSREEVIEIFEELVSIFDKKVEDIYSSFLDRKKILEEGFNYDYISLNFIEED